MSEHERPTTPMKTRRKREKVRKVRPEPETVDTDWRIFLAVPLPDEVIARTSEIIDHLRPRDWPMRWISPENAHLTLHFLGDTPPEQVAILRMMLPALVAEHEAFALRTAGLGVFPRLKKPRVLWLGLWGPAHRLETLYNELGDVLDQMQFPIEEKPFRPHITLGRLRSTRNTSLRELPEQIREAITGMAENGLADPDRPLPVPIEEVHLIRSHLGPGGPRYEIVDRFPLQPRQDESSTTTGPITGN